MRRSGELRTTFMLVALLGVFSAGAHAEPGYQVPPKPLADIVDAPEVPEGIVGPGGGWLLLMERPAAPTIAELSRPELRLAGLRFDPVTSGPSRTRGYDRLFLHSTTTEEERGIAGWPAGSSADDAAFSPDGEWVSFVVTTREGLELWLAAVSSGASHRLSTVRLNGVLPGVPCAWLPDSTGLVCRTLPTGRTDPPTSPDVPVTPVIEESLGRTAPARTYQDLLSNPHEADVFEYYATSQLVRIDLDGTVTSLGAPGIHFTPIPAPGGTYLLVSTVHRPFSYLVPVDRFPRRIEVWTPRGEGVHLVAEVPLAEEVPIAFDAVPEGVRHVDWRQDAPATLVWAEAQDGGDPRTKAAYRDRVFTLAAPFSAAPRPLAELALRLDDVMWGKGFALLSSRWRKDRRARVWLVRPESGDRPRLLLDYSTEDRYADPGRVLKRSTAGTELVVSDAAQRIVYLVGQGASPEGDRPFLDELDLGSGKTRRLWRCSGAVYETPVQLLGPKPDQLLTRRESVSEPPNYFVRNVVDGSERRLTRFPDPTPQLAGVSRELISYTRDDGVVLTANLYLPAGYDPADGPLPMLMWAYPREYKSAGAASQVRTSPYRFVRVRPLSPLAFLAMGYAVLDDPAMPIVGEGTAEPNDTYVKQLVASAKAAVDEVVRRGVAQRGRIAVGGHSYGAFMTANLLAHSDLFAAGIARSGAYNRTLTPFGFQAEERTFWQVPEVYFAMSPFMHADTLKTPILLIHGLADNNSGTFPLQSERFYAALKGLGGTARLVLLPAESHGYAARESLLHVLWEMNRWLETYTRGVQGHQTPAEVLREK